MENQLYLSDGFKLATLFPDPLYADLGRTIALLFLSTVIALFLFLALLLISFIVACALFELYLKLKYFFLHPVKEMSVEMKRKLQRKLKTAFSRNATLKMPAIAASADFRV